jgi:hypothetical protein
LSGWSRSDEWSKLGVTKLWTMNDGLAEVNVDVGELNVGRVMAIVE